VIVAARIMGVSSRTIYLEQDVAALKELNKEPVSTLATPKALSDRVERNSLKRHLETSGVVAAPKHR
jgi:hypothetical protein